LIKNGKYYFPPEEDGSDFKSLFMRLANAGAGRPLDVSGFPQGPWTPDLLAEAITRIDLNTSGIELRTVQLWFQDNDKGISPENIRWLARVFGCDDPEATSAWQAELGAAQARLAAKRRRDRHVMGLPERGVSDAEFLPAGENVASDSVQGAGPQSTRRSGRRFSLPLASEAIIGRGAPLDLPAVVFAGAVALGFLSYFLGIHSVTYALEDGVAKQVGFLWAPNWTILFMFFMPLFFVFAGDLLAFWKNQGRLQALTSWGTTKGDRGWANKVEGSIYTYWAVLLICLGFAGLFQWISVRLIPLLQGSGPYPIDWGSLSLALPEVYSVPLAIAFTGFAYLYMCLCFYLFFVGLILLYTVSHDLWEIEQPSALRKTPPQANVDWVHHRVLRGIFRCTICGLLIAICMKLQSVYLTTNATSVLSWLVSDSLSVYSGRGVENDRAHYTSPTHYTSLVIAMVAVVPFLHGIIRLTLGRRFNASAGMMVASMTVLSAAYLLIGALVGFSMLLIVAVLMAAYGLFDPTFGTRAKSDVGGRRNVL
jgi:hypothetical protein